MPADPPRGLQRAGKRAWRAARSDSGDDPAYREIVDAFAHAVDRARALELAWQAAGRPVLGMGGTHGKVQVPHPLLAAVERAEEHVRRLAHELELTPAAARGEARRGRPPGVADPFEALGAPPLRRVK